MSEPVTIEVGKRYKFQTRIHDDKRIIGHSTCDKLCYFWADDLDPYHGIRDIIATVDGIREFDDSFFIIYISDLEYL